MANPSASVPDVKEGEIINYMAAYDVTDKAKAEELGLSIKDGPAAEYAIVPVKVLYQLAFTMLGNMSWRSFPGNRLSPLRA